LQDMGFEAAHLKDGFTDWVKNGGQIAPLPKR
jgi:rhodanese-related sulfurtransferase